METSYEKNPRRILGYLMAFAMVFFSTSSAIAEDLTITVGGGTFDSEITWDVTDANGASLVGGAQPAGTWSGTIASGCYDFQMYDSWGDGWNGGIYTITDQTSGVIYATGGLAAGSYGMDVVCWPTVPCTDNEVTLNMTDSWGDGWNGNNWNLYDVSGSVVATGTILMGATGSETFCIPDGCYTWDCDGGSFQSEVAWDLVDASGVILASGGAPANGTLNLNSTCPLGCTDPAATNYDPLAAWDDGSCTYGACAAPAPYLESFSTGALPVGVCPVGWAISATTGGPWVFTGNPGYQAGSNGRPAGSYAWIDFSGTDAGVVMDVEAIDASTLATPTLAFDYFSDLGTYALTGAPNIMYVEYLNDSTGAYDTIATLQVDTPGWNTYTYPLLAGYTDANGVVTLRFRGESGGASNDFYNDLLLDELQVMEAPTYGCTDPLADNYDPLANLDDGSCLYTGCTDPNATNYCASCNVPDSSLCTYPACNALDFLENFESASLTTNSWLSAAGAEAGISLTTTNAISDTVSLEMTGGGSSAGWTLYSTEAEAFANTSHVASAQVCLDLSASTGNVNLTFDYQTSSAFANTSPNLPGASAYSTLRVKVNGQVVADVNGQSWHGSESYTTLTYDLSSLAGQSSVYVTFETACKYNLSYGWPDYVWFDNINVFNVNPCTYYGMVTDYAFDASCNGGSDGMVSASVTGEDPASTYTNSFVWTDAAGAVVGNTAALSGLGAGTYTCTVTDGTNGCTASTTATVGEPTAIIASGTVVDATSPINTDGSVTLAVAGGTPCYYGASDTLNTHDGNTSYIYSAGATGTTVFFDITALNACGITALTQYGVYMGAGDLEVWTRSGSANGNCQSSAGWTLNTAVLNTASVNGETMHIPLMSSIGLEAGDVVGIALHTPTTHYFTLGGNGAFVNTHASDANIAVSTGAIDANGPAFSAAVFLGDAASSYNPQIDVHYTAPSYTYAWSNGATTQNVSGLGMGPVAVTVTDCNGCTGTWSGFVAANVVNGCTDPNASNFDPTANTDDGSCLYPGCIDSLATNFDPNANVSDSSCTYPCSYYGYNNEINITVFTDLFGEEASWSVLDLNGDTVGAVNTGGYAHVSATYVHPLCANDGCYTMNWGDSFGDGWVDFNGTVGWILATDINGDTLSYQTVNGANANGSATLTLGSGLSCVAGCTDSTAVNYDASATFDDGSCAYCNDNYLVLNMFDSFGDGWNGSVFTMTDSSGAMLASATLSTGTSGTAVFCVPDNCYTVDVSSNPWNSEVSWDLADAFGTVIISGGAPYNSTLCLPASPGCTDPTACNYDANANTDNGSCDYSCYGCTDPTALNYDPLMTIDDGSCIYCGLSASTIVVDETAAGAFDGAVDLTVTGTYCVTTTDLFVSVAGGNGQSGNAFNLINTSGSDLYIDGFSQGPGSGNSTIVTDLEVFCSYGDYLSSPTWTSVATAAGVTLTSGLTTGYVQIPGGVTIPAGGTYGFWIGSSNGGIVQYTNGTGTPGVSPWASDANVTVTEGHGGTYPTGLNFSPRNWNGTVHYGDPNANVYSFAWNTGDTTEDLSNVTSGTYTVSITDCMGCTTSASATVSVNMVPGCTDPTAFNYNPSANFDDGSCIAVVNGCIDTTAANYDPSANTDDGSCHWCFGGYSVTIECTTNPWPTEVSWDLLDASGAVILSGGAPFLLDTCLAGGCYSIDMFDSFGDGWNGSVFSITDNTTGAVASATLAAGSFGQASLASAALGCFVYGCTDVMATNYDPLANTDDGSCTYPACVTSLPFSEDFETGQADVTLISTANGLSSIDSLNNSTWSWHGQGNGAWGATPTTGAGAFGSFPDHIATMGMCVDLTAYAGQPVTVSFDLRQEFSFNANYSWFRLTNDTGAVLSDGNGNDYHQPATACGDAWANVSYDLSAYAGSVVNLMFQSCNKYYDDYYQCGDNAYVDNINISIQATSVYGCTDSTAVNYDPAANTDDGSCCFGNWATLNMFDSFGDGWNGNYFVMTDVLTGAVVFNSTIVSGTSATDQGCIPDGCYDITVGGGSWQSEVSWDLDDGTGTIIASGGAPYTGQITIGNGSCAIGCTDSLAVNYDPTAMVDDGSCAYPCLDNSVYIAVITDYYGGECTWDITDASGAVVASGGPYPVGYNSASDSTCVTDGCYTLNMYDSFGDGWSTGQLGSVTLTDGMGGTYATGQLLTGTAGSWNFTVGTVAGCTDTNATNYDPCANSDDGSCTYPCTDNDVTITVGGGSWLSEVSWDLVDGSGAIVVSGVASTYTACLPNDCYTMNMYDAFGDGWNGSTYTITDNNTGTVYGTGGLLSGSSGSDLISIGAACPVYGCTDSLANNYDPLADTDDGSCIYPLPCNGDAFCDDFESGAFAAGNWLTSAGSEAAVAVTATNPNGTLSAEFQGGNYVGWAGGSSSATGWDSPDHISAIEMCLDLSNVSGGPLSMTLDYNSQSYFGASYGNYSHFRVLVNGDSIPDANGMYEHYAPGALTLSYDLSSYAGGNPTVTLQAACKYGDVYSAGAYNDYVWVDNLCLISAVPGCTDTNATNYNPNATQDDGSCTYTCAYYGLDEVTVNLYDSFGDGWNGNTLTVDGTDYTLPSGSSGSFTACVDLSTCITATYNATGSWTSENSWDITDASGAVLLSGGNVGSGGDFGNCGVPGCMDSTACNYDVLATVDDGSCILPDGCTDPTALNYDSLALCDDGSCIAIVYGCTDMLALNYFPGANVDDGTCCYVAGCTDPAACNYDSLACQDDGSCLTVWGCTDPTATNYDPLATCDDGSCIISSSCTPVPVTGVYMSDIIHNRATFNWDSMNQGSCQVDQMVIRYREQGTNSWTQKFLGNPTGSTIYYGTSKRVLGLTAATTYEYQFKIWYMGVNSPVNWGANPSGTFTTLGSCPNVGNFTVSTPLTTRAVFTWDDSNGPYSFARIKLRVDSISNPTGADWSNAGGFGVVYPTFTRNKNGLTPGETYRGQSRTWCDPAGGPYKSDAWTPLVFWTQPTVIRLGGETAIANLDVYPNPSRDIFNVTFTSEETQDLEVRVINVVGEVIYTENLEQFVGEYTKQVDLATYTKGVYFLEITTNNGVVNKKLILQ